MVETGKRRAVAHDPVIPRVPSEFLTQCLVLFRDRIVTMKPAPLVDRPDRPCESTRRRLPLQDPVPALEQLEESRANYSDLYDFAPVGYLTLDEKGFIREANLTASRQIGIDRSNLIDTPFSVHLSRSDGDRFRLHLDQGFRSMERQACEVRLRPKDGGEFAMPCSMSIFVQDVHGKVSCRTSVIDITERKRAEEALRRKRKSYRELVQHQTVPSSAGRVMARSPLSMNTPKRSSGTRKRRSSGGT